jgi:hypothetical protein
MLHTRWTLLEIRKDALQQGLPAPDEACARHHCLHQGVEAPDLATIKEFFRFYIATSCGRIVAKLTVDSINTNTEWFFTGFTRVTDTEINEKDNTKEVIATGDKGPHVYLEGRAYFWWHTVVWFRASAYVVARIPMAHTAIPRFLTYCDISIVNLYSVIMRWTSQSSDHSNAATASQPQ